MSFCENLHPSVFFVYFICVTLPAMFLWNPVILLIALVSGIAVTFFTLKSGKKLRRIGLYLAVILISAITNPIFSHKGATPLFFINDNAVTAESIFYGACVGIMLTSVIAWFGVFSRVMSSDKYMCLFGRLAPGLSLTLSMAIRFIPIFLQRTKEMMSVQSAMRRSDKGRKTKISLRLEVLSAMAGRSLEESVETSMSMKARGYGVGRRTSFSPTVFTRRDGAAIALILPLFLLTVCGAGLGAVDFSFYPRVAMTDVTLLSPVVWLAYAALAFLPVIIIITEDVKWKYCVSKI